MRQRVYKYLLEIEKELKTLCLWSALSPSYEAMRSQFPFACDTMPLESWLQFIFLPRMHSIIEEQLLLPTSIGVAPIAEQVWGDKKEFQELIRLLTDLDADINATR